MENLRFINLVFFLLLLLPISVQCDFVIGAYLPDYRAYLDVNKTAVMLTDLILFSIEPMKIGKTTHALKSQCCLGALHYKLGHDARNHRKEKHNKKEAMKLWASIGGAGRSSGFQSILMNKSKRSDFIISMISLCQEENLDGIDLDHEEIRVRMNTMRI